MAGRQCRSTDHGPRNRGATAQAVPWVAAPRVVQSRMPRSRGLPAGGGTVGWPSGNSPSESEAAELESVSSSSPGESVVRAKWRASALDVMRMSRAAPSAGGRWRCPQSEACRKEAWWRKEASRPASVRGARNVGIRGRPAGCRRRHASATAGHHIQMFRSALAQATQRARAMRGGLPVAQLWVSSGRESSRAPKFHGVSTEVRRKEVVGK
jgi:hypothetical protein